MPVGANIRVGAMSADPAAPAALEGASIEEIFGEIIAAIGDAAAPPPLTAEIVKASAATNPGETPAAGELAAAVEQLLALVSGQSATGEHAPESEQPTAEPDTKSTEPQVAPSLEAPVTQISVILPEIVQQLPVRQEQPVAGKEVPTSPAGPTQAIPAPVRQPLEPVASRRTGTVVQLALSNLEAAVKALPAQAWMGAQPAKPAKRVEGEAAPALQEVRTVAPLIPTILSAITAPAEPRPMTEAASTAPLESAPAEMMVENQLDLAHEGEWLDRLARDIARTADGEGNPLRFRLNPETLGTLRVEITQDRNGAAVRLTADTEAARTIIADAQPRLVAEARAQGVRISETHVDLGGHTASGDPRRQNAASEEAPLRTARSLREEDEGDGKPTPGRSERYA